MKHIDALFNALTCLVGLLGVKFSEAAMTALSIAFQRIQGLVLNDPVSAISQLKKAAKLYLEYIRDPSNPDLIPTVEAAEWTTSNFHSIEAVEEALKGFPLLSSVVSLRKVLYGTYKFESLIAYDRVVYALLSMHRVIVLPPVMDFKSITDPGTGSDAKITDEEIASALDTLGITPSEFKERLHAKSATQQHYIMASAGPNGPATWTAYSDAIALLEDLTIWKQFRTLAEKMKLSRFVDHLIAVSAVPNSDPVPGTPVYSGRIHTFEEWGGKTRNVAIVDYWTQLILTPLHDTIFDYLRALTTDSTFDQDAACETIRQWTANKDSALNSFDLTAATDRLPASFQVRILKYLLGDAALAQAWADVLSKRLYRTSDYQMISYSVGLPMGSKSNWAMLALTHHVIIQIAASRALDNTSGHVLANPGAPVTSTPKGMLPGPGSYSAYRVCGDDGCMNGTRVAIEYKAIMSQLALVINDDKSVLHNTTALPAAEFCKRVFIAGLELTTIPVKLLVKTTMNGRLAPQLQSLLVSRGMSLPGSGIMSWMAALVDHESFSFLVVLNLIPTAISGLTGTVPLPHNAPKFETMLDETVTLDEGKITQGYTYTAAVEELKRLDALLRTTEAVHKGIEQHLLGFDHINLDDLGWAGDLEGAPVLAQLKAMKHEIGYTHPVVMAAMAETSRVVNLLAQLAAGATDISTLARLRLLDSFRNALVAAWADPQAARAQADRTLIQKTLLSMADQISTTIINTRSRVSSPATLTFTTLISYLSRLWTVRWPFSGTVTINTVKSRVIASSTAASSQADLFSGDVRIVKSVRSLIQSKTSKP
jgi:hypothetical protein